MFDKGEFLLFLWVFVTKRLGTNKQRFKIFFSILMAFKNFFYLNFEGEILFHVLDDHDQVWQLDTQSFLRKPGR